MLVYCPSLIVFCLAFISFALPKLLIAECISCCSRLFVLISLSVFSSHSISSVLEVGQEITGEVVGRLKGMPVVSLKSMQLEVAWDQLNAAKEADSPIDVVVLEVKPVRHLASQTLLLLYLLVLIFYARFCSCRAAQCVRSLVCRPSCPDRISWVSRTPLCSARPSR